MIPGVFARQLALTVDHQEDNRVAQPLRVCIAEIAKRLFSTAARDNSRHPATGKSLVADHSAHV